MIEFKRDGDVMTFDCASFKIEVAGDAERIEFADILNEPISRVTEAFKVLDMMIKHKSRNKSIIKTDINICEGTNSDIEALKRRLADSNNLRCVAGD